MARPATTPAQRAASVNLAVVNLPAVCQAATAALATYGASDPRSIAAWEEVEKLGATVHRQSRLLAGKSKGG